MRLWSKLEPWEWRDELARVHPELTEGCLIACGRAVPELAPRINAQKSKEDQMRVVLRYFGDEGHTQPDGTTRYGGAINGGGVIECPRWERLPPLEGAAPGETKLDERGEKSRIPYPSFWWILEQRVKRGKAATPYSLSERTRRSTRMSFVGRTLMTHLVKWIDDNPEAAARAHELHEPPAGFRANERGVIVPGSRKRA